MSRLDETQKLNDIGRKAEEILAAARPLSDQTIVIRDTAPEHRRLGLEHPAQRQRAREPIATAPCSFRARVR